MVSKKQVESRNRTIENPLLHLGMIYEQGNSNVTQIPLMILDTEKIHLMFDGS